MVKEKSCTKEHNTNKKQANRGILKPSARQTNAGDVSDLAEVMPTVEL